MDERLLAACRAWCREEQQDFDKLPETDRRTIEAAVLRAISPRAPLPRGKFELGRIGAARVAFWGNKRLAAVMNKRCSV